MIEIDDEREGRNGDNEIIGVEIERERERDTGEIWRKRIMQSLSKTKDTQKKLEQKIQMGEKD